VFIHIYRYYDVEFANFFIDYPDDIFYGRIAQNIVSTGIENSFGLNDYFKNTAINPYHYSELWFTGVYSKIFSVNTVLFHSIITYSFGSAVFVIGIASFFEKIFSKRIFLYLPLAFISGLDTINKLFEGKLYFIENSSIWISDIFAFPKLFPVYFLFIAYAILTFHYKSSWAFFFISLSTVVFYSIIPGICILFIVMIILQYWHQRKFEISNLIPVAVSILVFLFYKLTGSNSFGYMNQKVDFVTLITDKNMFFIKGVFFNSFSNFMC
jgi:hypothetical protein